MIKINDIRKLPRSIVAAAFGVTKPAVNHWKKRGCPSNDDGTYDLAAVIQWRLDGLALTDKETCESPEAQRWLIAYRRERAKAARIQRKALSRDFIPADEVEIVGFEAGRQIRDACLAIPDRCAALVKHAKDENEVKQILTKEIRLILENLADRLEKIK
jgi:phage terminase Nu1 subunit (DNA packaging protein)